MTVHLFGATSSPSCANFGLRRTAEDNRHAFSQDAVDTVRKNVYVDDCFKSVPTKPKAVVLADELRQLLAKGEFHLTKWISNSRNVLDTIPASKRAGSVQDLLLSRLPMERALGVRWDVESDTFGFKITIKDKPPTRRGILSVVCSVYDPLGFAAPFILPAKSYYKTYAVGTWAGATPSRMKNSLNGEIGLKIFPSPVERCFKPSKSTPSFRRCLATRVWCRHLSPSHKH